MRPARAAPGSQRPPGRRPPRGRRRPVRVAHVTTAAVSLRYLLLNQLDAIGEGGYVGNGGVLSR